jgi:hypothetical protein
MGNFDPNYTREGLSTLGAVAYPRLDSAINLRTPVAGACHQRLNRSPNLFPKKQCDARKLVDYRHASDSAPAGSDGRFAAEKRHHLRA